MTARLLAALGAFAGGGFLGGHFFGLNGAMVLSILGFFAGLLLLKERN
jgi:hypothetical protein